MLVQGGPRTAVDTNAPHQPPYSLDPQSISPRNIGEDRFRTAGTSQNARDGLGQNEPSDRSGPYEAPPASFFVQAQYPYDSSDTSSLSFVKDDVIEVLTQLPSGWWDGLLGLKRGWFPSNYVRKIEPWEAEAWYDKLAQEVEVVQEDENSEAGERQEGIDGEDDTLTGVRTKPSRPLENDQELGIATQRHSGSQYVDSPLPDDSPTESGIMHDGLDRASQENRSSAEGLPMADQEPREQPDEETGNAEDFWVPNMTQDGQVSRSHR